MLSKEMLGTQSFLVRHWRERQRSTDADRIGLASEAALHGYWTSINVTLKKAVDRVELESSQSQVSNPSSGLGTAVSK